LTGGSTARVRSAEELREEVVRLGPWHVEVDITPEVSTAAFLDAPADGDHEDFGVVHFQRPHAGFLRRMGRVFPQGMAGRRVLDCACNCGYFLFWSREVGAGECLGFDAREHWIRQARFLAAHRAQPSDGIRFEVCDLYDLPTLDPGRFDVTFFNGIFYHLPNPITGLKLAADRTDELLVLNTATMAGRPDGAIVADEESPTKLMSGLYGLNWFPTGPLVLTGILRWLGFTEVRCSAWRSPPNQSDRLGRIELLAARREGFFDAWDAALTDPQERFVEAVRTNVPPGERVLVPDCPDLPVLIDREPVPVAGGRPPGDAAVAEVERHRAEGVAWAAIPDFAPEWLRDRPVLSDHLHGRYPSVSRPESGATVFSLGHA
jgi:tRNA (mo5U34)-methyltransferase